MKEKERRLCMDSRNEGCGEAMWGGAIDTILDSSRRVIAYADRATLPPLL